MNYYVNECGKHIRQLRIQHGYTQEGLSKELRQYRIIGQERVASKFCVLTRRGFAAILAVLQEIATKSGCKISAKCRSFNCAMLP